MDTLNHETMRASRNVILNRKTLIELFTNQELRVFAEKMYIKSYLMQGQTMDLSREKKILDLCVTADITVLKVIRIEKRQNDLLRNSWWDLEASSRENGDIITFFLN